MSNDARIRELNLQIPPPNRPAGNYVRAKRTGNLLYIAGHVPPINADGSRRIGKVGADLTADEAYAEARSVGLALLSTLLDELGSLDKVAQVVKVVGMVNCAPEFTEIPRVINGCSDLMVEVFGKEAGSHARSAVGMASLPGGVPVEVEMIVELAP